MGQSFSYEYVGGGYWRKRGVPRGQKAEILHGEEAIRVAQQEVASAEPPKGLATRMRALLDDHTHAVCATDGPPCTDRFCSEARALLNTDATAAACAQLDAMPDLLEASRRNEEAERSLASAIRAITVDLPDDQPNGDAEKVMVELGEILDAPWPLATADCHAKLATICDALSRLCGHLADDTKRLRLAAEAYFGGDFRSPTTEGA